MLSDGGRLGVPLLRVCDLVTGAKFIALLANAPTFADQIPAENKNRFDQMTRSLIQPVSNPCERVLGAIRSRISRA
jgi:hypothetical protein